MALSDPVDDDRELQLLAAPPSGVRERRRLTAMHLALVWLGLVMFGAVFADILPILSPQAIEPTAMATGPSGAHWFGTDELGRDLFSRVVFGARTSLLLGIGVVTIAGSVGGFLGIVAGYLRRRTDTVIMGFMDALLSFPALVLALALTAFLGANVRNLIIAISVIAVPSFARISRSRALSLAEREFVLAARAIGVPHWRIVARELVPNVLPTIGTYALVIIALAIIVEGSLSFLGLGVPPPTATWGGTISAGRGQLTSAPHISLIPSFVLLLTVLSLNVLGEHLRRRVDQ